MKRSMMDWPEIEFAVCLLLKTALGAVGDAYSMCSTIDYFLGRDKLDNDNTDIN